MRLAWATDIHLDHANEAARRKFCESVNEQADAVVIAGDIAESRILGASLTMLADLIVRPVYFILGNHDFYRGSVTSTRRVVGYVVSESKGLDLFDPGRCGAIDAKHGSRGPRRLGRWPVGRSRRLRRDPQ